MAPEQHSRTSGKFLLVQLVDQPHRRVRPADVVVLARPIEQSDGDRPLAGGIDALRKDFGVVSRVVADVLRDDIDQLLAQAVQRFANARQKAGNMG